MAPESTSALEEKIDWREIGNDEIEIKIKRLFDDLRRNQHVASAIAGGGLAAETGKNRVLDRKSITLRETRVKNMHRSLRPQSRQCSVDFDRFIDRVADDKHRCPSIGGFARDANCCWAIGNSLDANRPGQSRVQAGSALLDAPGRHAREQRIASEAPVPARLRASFDPYPSPQRNACAIL